MKRPLLVCFLLSASLFCLSAESQLIHVAVMELEVTDEVGLRSKTELGNLFAADIAETGVFQVAERADLDKVLGELSLQQSGAIDPNNMVRIGQMMNVRYLLFGSLGRLFGKLVLTAKLVEIEKGQVVLARTMTSDDTRFFGDLKRFALELGGTAFDLNVPVSLEMIAEAADKGDLQKARDYLDRYVALQGIGPETEALRAGIVPRLADSLAKSADDFRKHHKYQEALEAIQRALALRIKESYITSRDRILQEEAAYLDKQRQSQERAEQARKNRERFYAQMLEDGQTSVVGAYFNNISVLGHHLGVNSEWFIDDRYAIPDAPGVWGFQYLSVTDPLGLTDPRPDKRGTDVVNRVFYIGATAQYDRDGADDANTVKGQAYASPYLSEGFKLLNAVVLLGIDGGGGVLFSRDADGGLAWFAGGGLTASTELKISRRTGLFLMLRGSYEWYPENTDLSGPRLQAAAGVTL